MLVLCTYVMYVGVGVVWDRFLLYMSLNSCHELNFLMLLLLSHLKQLYINKMKCFGYKGECGVCEHCTCIKEFKRGVTLGYR